VFHKLVRGPILWVTPMVALIVGVVLWPVFEMIRTSLTQVGRSGQLQGFTGLDNYDRVFANPNLAGAFGRTLFWVIAVVAVTILISLVLAQLLNQDFPGRRIVRWALIVPWASSVIMTATSFRWMLDGYYGILNRALLDLGLIDGPVEWLGSAETSFPWLIVVAIFVSLPFTTFVFLAGLQTIPKEVYEAARVDGAGAWKSYFGITLPMLSSALFVATVINMINVFNQFPIIWIMTNGGPGYTTDTTTTLMYKLAFRSQEIGASAALSVLNFAVIMVFVLIYLRATGFMKRKDEVTTG
jgi:multiple sugar transport system permease protein